VIDESAIRQRFEALAPVLDERGPTTLAAAEAIAAGRAALAPSCAPQACAQHDRPWAGRIACWADTGCGPRAQAGRRTQPLSETDASLLDDLRSLVEPATRGDPQSPLLWTCKSLRKLAESLRGMGHKIGRTLVGELLHKLDYSLQANRKTREGSNHADRDAQFHYSMIW